MQHTLKLTITAVGENDSVFLTPCDPVTLHESCIEEPEPAPDHGHAEAQQAEPVVEPSRTDRGSSPREGEDVVVMVEN